VPAPHPLRSWASPPGYRRITLVALVALCAIVVTGAAVRLTGSGLGCPDWPTCERGRVVAPMEYHAMVEFVNRTVTGLVSLAVALAVLGSLAQRPWRRDLVVLSLGLVAGVAAQIVLGGLTVLFELSPPFVMAHFLLSMVLLANAVVLHRRASEPPGPRRPVVPRELVAMTRALVAAAAVVLVTGTVVTAAGPHGGDEDVERLDLFVPDVARVHGAAVVLLLVLTLVTLWWLRRESAPGPVRRAGEVFLAVLCGQAAVGYVQYFTDVPEVLVGLHVAGAVAVWVAVLHLALAVHIPAAGPPVPDRRAAMVDAPSG
jgi:cytochrome c oxidase assembly protein subunit 15